MSGDINAKFSILFVRRRTSSDNTSEDPKYKFQGLFQFLWMFFTQWWWYKTYMTPDMCSVFLLI
jgi:hypothetical protein